MRLLLIALLALPLAGCFSIGIDSPAPVVYQPPPVVYQPGPSVVVGRWNGGGWHGGWGHEHEHWRRHW